MRVKSRIVLLATIVFAVLSSSSSAQQAAVIAEVVNNYEATFVSTGRTLAEIINLPAKIFTKMIWLHNIMEVTEGPVSASMMAVYARLNTVRDAADTDYQEKIAEAMSRFEAAVN